MDTKQVTSKWKDRGRTAAVAMASASLALGAVVSTGSGSVANAWEPSHAAVQLVEDASAQTVVPAAGSALADSPSNKSWAVASLSKRTAVAVDSPTGNEWRRSPSTKMARTGAASLNKDWLASSTSTTASKAARNTVVEVRVDAARHRSRPVTGQVLRLFPRYMWLSVSCQAKGSDGYAWGRVFYAGRTGWVRSDLYYVVSFTGPGGSHQPNGPIPWC